MGCYGSKQQQQQHDAEGKPQLDEEYRVEEPLANKEAADRSRKVLRSLLAAKDRDYLVDRSGKRVKVDQLRGKPIGLLFAAFAVPPAREFTKQLTEVYRELRSKGKAFEVVYLHNDQSQEIWKQGLKEMGWLAVPFSDQSTGDSLGQNFSVVDIPTLVLLDMEGNFVTNDGVEVIKAFGTRAWPFSDEQIQSLRSSQVRGMDGKKGEGSSWRDAGGDKGDGQSELRYHGEEHVKEHQVAPADFDSFETV